MKGWKKASKIDLVVAGPKRYTYPMRCKWILYTYEILHRQDTYLLILWTLSGKTTIETEKYMNVCIFIFINRLKVTPSAFLRMTGSSLDYIFEWVISFYHHRQTLEISSKILVVNHHLKTDRNTSARSGPLVFAISSQFIHFQTFCLKFL